MAAASAPPPPQTAQPLPGDDVAAPAAGNQTDPYIATGGSGFLAVWADARSSLHDPTGEGGTGRDIFAARLDADGQLIDTTPIAVTVEASEQTEPRAFWNGSAWLVLWSTRVPYGPYYHNNIECARLSADGQVLDTTPMLIWDEGGVVDDFRGGASNGTDWALIFQQTYQDGLGTKERLIGKRVLPNGAVVNAPYNLYSPSCCVGFTHMGVAYANGVYMAVFHGYVDSWNYGIFALRMNSSLQVLDSYPLVLAETQWSQDLYYYNPNIASDGDHFYVTWQLWDLYASSQVYGARIEPDGTSLDGDGVPISNILPDQIELHPTVAWAGTQWIVGWPEADPMLARVGADGGVIDPGGVSFPALSNPAFAGAADGVQALWPDNRAGGAMPWDIYSARVDANLNLGADACVSLGAPAQREAEVALGGMSALLAYRSESSGSARVKAQLFDLRGSPLMDSPIDLAPDLKGAPAVASNGTRYLVTWGDASSGDVLALRVDESGAVLDGAPFTVLAGSDPEVGVLNGVFLVCVSGASGAYCARVSDDGSVLDTPALELDSGSCGRIDVGTLGDLYWLPVWEVFGQQDGSELRAAYVLPGGAVAGPLAVSEEGDGIAPLRPAVASGGIVLIAWQDSRAGDDNLDLYGRRLDASTLSFLDPPSGLPLTDVTGDQSEPDMAWDGQRFVCDYLDDRAQVNDLDHRLQTYRNWLEPDGSDLEEPGGVSLLGSLDASTIDPAVAADTDGNTFYVASVFNADVPYAAYRLLVRWAGEPTGVEQTPVARHQLAIYPNPANPSVQIRFELAAQGSAELDIYDLRGARVARMQTGSLPAGSHELHWNGTRDDGRELPSGVYFVRLVDSSGAEQTSKLTLLR